MITVNLSTDEWEGRRNVGRIVKDAAIEDVLNAVDSLDGVGHDSLIIEINEEHYMAVGGGKDDRFVTSIVDGDKTHSLIGEVNAEGEEFMKIGGQRTPFAKSLVVTRESVRAAVVEFISSGLPSSDLHWLTEMN